MFIAVLGIIVHLVLLFSVFDIYFRSPIMHGMTPIEHSLPPPAKRIVLFVADGLRADRFYELDSYGHSRAPFLRNIILTKGVWGISHTRVPTESRPGHVALIAGFYEDISAIAKGWKENPVEFDSVFNQSRNTWAWGSPDIVPMFAKGSSAEHIFTTTYFAEDEDFAGANPSNLDTWVFQKFEEFLKGANKDNSLLEKLHADKIVFFLHLLGLDTNGHARKPHSREYFENIGLVDKGIEHCVKLIENFYGQDGKTAYIFTSDHGMTDWGSHGAGNPDETRTPIVAWGAGIRKSLGAGRDLYNDGLAEEWKLSSVRRTDVGQADITPLMSVLIGTPIPVNSVGTLPVQFLNTTWQHRAESLLTNSRQVLSQFHLKKKMKEETTLPIFFTQFRELSTVKQAEFEEMISVLLKQKRYKDTIQVALKVIELSLKGLNYYEKYDRFSLCCSVFLGFVGWMSYIVLLIIRDHTVVLHTSLEALSTKREDAKLDMWRKVKIGLLSFVVTGITVSLLYVQSSPVMYYCYFLLTVLLWTLVGFNWDVWQKTKEYAGKENILQICAVLLLIVFGLELLVATFFWRSMLSVCLFAAGIWSLMTRLRDSNKFLAFSWSGACIGNIVFPLLPVVGRDSNYTLVTLAGWLGIVLTAFCAKRSELALVKNSRTRRKEPQHVVIVTALQVFFIWLAIYTVKSVDSSISRKEGLPLWCQVFSWIVLAISLILPLFGSSFLLTRLLNIISSLLAPYLLMCIAHEGIFCLGLCVLMFLWVCIEHQLENSIVLLQDIQFDSSLDNQQSKLIPHNIGMNDLRRAYFFLLFILFAYFGTGNIASINSFEPTSVYCFLTVFSPFTMGFLLVLKIVIPFVIVSCCFRAVLVTIRVSPKALFLLVLVMSDFMAMHFFFLVRDSGSWLDIGSSLSHYIIMMSTITLVMMLYGLAWILTTVKLSLSSVYLKRHAQ